MSSFYFLKIDFIYYTGDTPAHNVWNQSRSDQLYSINTINNILATIFPNKTFYSAVGNHETGINIILIIYLF
jgi:sphingomyelin phosphodiesterase